MKLSEVIDLFINRPDIRPATARSYSYDLRALLNWLGDKVIDEIHPVDILRYFQHLDKKPDVESNYTYNKHLKSARALFSFAVNMHLIERSPMKAVKLKRVKKQVSAEKTMPELKLMALIQYTEATPRGWHPREEALVRFFADTGARCASVAALVWSDIDMVRGVARLRHGKARDDPHAVAFGKPCQEALEAWYAEQGQVEGYTVFSATGAEIESSSLGDYFRRLGKRAGIGSWGTHSLRHRFGRRAYKQYGLVIAAQMLDDTPEIVAAHYADADNETVLQLMKNLATRTVTDPETPQEKVVYLKSV